MPSTGTAARRRAGTVSFGPISSQIGFFCAIRRSLCACDVACRMYLTNEGARGLREFGYTRSKFLPNQRQFRSKKISAKRGVGPSARCRLVRIGRTSTSSWRHSSCKRLSLCFFFRSPFLLECQDGRTGAELSVRPVRFRSIPDRTASSFFRCCSTHIQSARCKKVDSYRDATAQRRLARKLSVREEYEYHRCNVPDF